MNAFTSIFATPRKPDHDDPRNRADPVKLAMDPPSSEAPPRPSSQLVDAAEEAQNEASSPGKRDGSRFAQIFGGARDYIDSAREALSPSPLPDVSTIQPRSAMKSESPTRPSTDRRVSFVDGYGPTERNVSRPPVPMAQMDSFDIESAEASSPVRRSKASPKTTEKSTNKTKSQQQQKQDVAMGSDDVFEFTGFKSYRWVDDKIEIQVEWDQGPSSWEPEEDLQRDAPQALYKFWKSKGGRPTNPDDPDMFTIFAILNHSKDRKRVRVQWTGYGPKDATWEPRRSVDQTAPGVVDEYFKGVKEKESAQAASSRRGKGKQKKGVAKRRQRN